MNYLHFSGSCSRMGANLLGDEKKARNCLDANTRTIVGINTEQLYNVFDIFYAHRVQKKGRIRTRKSIGHSHQESRETFGFIYTTENTRVSGQCSKWTKNEEKCSSCTWVG